MTLLLPGPKLRTQNITDLSPVSVSVQSGDRGMLHNDVCEQLAQNDYVTAEWSEVKP